MYCGLSLIFAILRNFRVADAQGFFCTHRANIVLLSQRESFVTVKIFESKILMNFDVFEVPDSE